MIRLPYEMADKITVDVLLEIMEDFKKDLKGDNPMIFVKDPIKDKKEIQKHINACKLIIKYFGK